MRAGPAIRFLLLALLAVRPVFAAEPVSLFNGRDLSGWTDAAGKPVTGDGWRVEDGVLHRAGKGGDIFSEKEYGDFTLEFEWKLAAGGNSGVKYRVRAYEGKGILGFEYQLLDDERHPDGRAGTTHRTAALYDLLPASGEVVVNPPGEWNTSKIVVKGTRIEHWLNGKRVLEVDVATDAFREARGKSKFRGVPGFGENLRGRIMLQDHGDEVWFRNLRITEG